MKKLLRDFKKNRKKGFTLIELLTVIVILAIVLIVVIPTVINSISEAKSAQLVNATSTVSDFVSKKQQYLDFGLGDDSTYSEFISTCYPNGLDHSYTEAMQNDHALSNCQLSASFLKEAGISDPEKNIDLENSYIWKTNNDKIGVRLTAKEGGAFYVNGRDNYFAVNDDESNDPGVNIQYNPITDFEYEIGTGDRAGYVILTKYIGSSTEVVVPGTYTIDNVTYNVGLYTKNFGYKVEGVFKGNTSITSVYLDSAVVYFYVNWNSQWFINNMTYVFSGCTNLVSSPAISTGVTDMTGAFSGCTRLTVAPTIPSSVTNMTETFLNCTNLVNGPTILGSVTDMSSTFRGCTSLVNAPSIPSSVVNMNATFSGCTSLKNAPSIPNGVTNLSSTFGGCTSLEEAPSIPSSVTNMNATFVGCTRITTAPTIPSNVADITSMFKDCTSLAGTVRINSENAVAGYRESSLDPSTGTYIIPVTDPLKNPFYGTAESITVEVPYNSVTYRNVDTDKPSNVTIVTFTPR